MKLVPVVVFALTVTSGAVLLCIAITSSDESKCDAEALHAAPGFSGIRVLTKQLLADDVLDRRRSLPEAASLFRVLDAMPPVVSARVEFYGPAGVVEGSDEHLCLQVIRYMRTRTDPKYGGDPAREPDVVRFEEELRTLIAESKLHLPDPASLPALDGVMARAWARDQAKTGWAEKLALAPTTRPAGKAEFENRE